jgi:ATP-dependent DNA helicase RecQ
MHSLADALTSLRAHFGFDDFREGQREVIGAILAGKDAVVVMPTGSGKSLCYQLPAMMLGGATVVVSPLIALMKDQVDALRSRQLPATFINSSIAPTEQRARIEALRRGEFKLVYVAPERFRSGNFVAAIQSIGVSLFAVDEAHCISTWGHDFRPDYLRLKGALQSLGTVQTLALTATATPYVRSDIIQQLGLSNPETFVSGFDRPNLSIDVVQTETEREKVARIKRLAKTQDGSGIVYASTRKAVEQVARQLQEHGLLVASYHAGMGDSVRIKAQEDFMAGRTQMIVATNAFGMGIDKPDIRFVAHYQMPGSIEAYYQEIGRAGRDGLPSSCVLLFNYADKNTHDFFIEGSYPSSQLVQSVYDALSSTGLKRIELSASEIGKRAGASNEMAVQSALYLLERAGHIQRLARSNLSAGVAVSPTGPAPWDAGSPAGGMPHTGAAARRARHIIMLDNAPSRLRVNPADVARRAALERRKLREMIDFCYTEHCYRAHILDYFGDRHHARQCGTCGNCAPHSGARSPLTSAEVLNDVPGSSRRTGKSRTEFVDSTFRALSVDETLRVRKILAGAKRLKGRFGKTVLAASLRGSAAKNVMQSHLNELSTYGLLKDMRQDDILIYIDALIRARCLKISPGEYPTVSITELGDRVMREQEQIELALPQVSGVQPHVKVPGTEELGPTKTMMETYSFYQQGLPIEEIARQRNCTTGTVECHLIDCIRAGFAVDIARFVSTAERLLIEKAIAEHGAERLKPLHDSLPETITYNMIRFVVAEIRQLEKSAVDANKAYGQSNR